MYSDGYSIRDYGGMIRDSRRFTPYLEALKRHVNADSVVLDIGAGTGILSMLACQLGARRVFAVEPDHSIDVGKLCSAKTPGAERITWIKDLSTHITLPEQADIVVGDLHGVLPFYTGNIASIADARRRHLKPGGLVLPRRDVLYAVPATASREYRTIEEPWRHNDMGLVLTDAVPFLHNAWWRAESKPVDAECLLAKPASWGRIDYNTVEDPSLTGDAAWQAARDGTMHGFYVWFDGEVADGLGFSNSPLLPELVYGRGFFPLPEPVQVRAGDRIGLRLAVKSQRGGEYIYRWNTTLESSDGATRRAFRQSNFNILPGLEQDLLKSNADYRPALGREGEIEHAILSSMDGEATSAQIAATLQSRFADRFASIDEALDAVVRVARKFG